MQLSRLFFTLSLVLALLVRISHSESVEIPRSLNRISKWRFPGPLPLNEPQIMPALRRKDKQEKKKPTAAPTCIPLLTPPPSSRIIGGDKDTELVPYMAALYWKFGPKKDDFVLFCSGLVLDSEWVMTAAHCRDGLGLPIKFGKDVYAFIGAKKGRKGTKMLAERIVLPKQTGEKHFFYNNDIAMIKLASPVPEGIKTMRVNIDDDFPGDGLNLARVAGYGVAESTHEGQPLPPIDEILRQTDMLVISNEQCRRFYSKLKKPVTIRDSMICALADGCVPCEADSGGPLLQYDKKGRPFVIGVTSANVECNSTIPTIFTRVSSFAKFMRSKKVDFEGVPGTLQLPSPSPSKEVPAPEESPSLSPSSSPDLSPSSSPDLSPNSSPDLSPSPSPDLSPSSSPISGSSGSSQANSGTTPSVDGTSRGTKALYGIAGVAGVAIIAGIAIFVFVRRRNSGVPSQNLPNV